MHLITPYAPGSFLKPIILISTLVNSQTSETAIQFVEALHVWHALDVSNCHDRNCKDVMASDFIRESKKSGWLIIQKHASPGAALEFHLNLTKDFINGASDEEWKQGWEPYIELYNRFQAEKSE